MLVSGADAGEDGAGGGGKPVGVEGGLKRAELARALVGLEAGGRVQIGRASCRERV